MKKKIIFVTEALWIGGIETALVNLLNRLDYEKYDVTCLLLRNDRTMASGLPKQVRLLVADREHKVSFDEAYPFARLYHLTEESDAPSRRHKIMMWAVPAIKWVENRLYIRYIRKHLAGESFDTCVIYSDRTAETAVRGIRADRFLMFYHHGAMRRVYHDEPGYRKSEKIIAVSNALEEKLRAYRPRYAKKMTTIHNLTDVDGILRKSEEPIPEEFSPDKFHIVSCGRVSREKGMDLAVEACARLVEMGHTHIHWWIVGGGPAEKEVRDKITQLQMENYVTMLGMKRNPYPYIKKADLYVQPSRFESFGLTVAEAIVLERPILSTDTDGARVIAKLEQAVCLCGGTSEAIASAVADFFGQRQPKQTDRAAIEAENQRILAQLAELL